MALGFGRRRFRRAIRRNRRNPLTQRRGKRGRFFKKVISKKDQVMVNNSKPSLNLPINPRFLTKFTASLSAQIRAGTYSGGATVDELASGQGVFAIKLNSPWLPFNATNPSGVAPGAALNNMIILGGIALNDLNPRGFDQLVGPAMYQKFRVYASKIKVTFVPHSIEDTPVVALYPTTNNTIGSSDAIQSQNIAYSKEKVMSTNSDMGNNTITHYIDLTSLDGLSREQLMADESKVGNMSSTPTDPTDLSYWVVRYRNLNSSSTDTTETTGIPLNFITPINVNIEVTYYTELFEVNYESMDL